MGYNDFHGFMTCDSLKTRISRIPLPQSDTQVPDATNATLSDGH